MIHMKRALAPLLIALTIVSTITIYPLRLSQFNYNTASVLPTYMRCGKQYGIISREAYGKDRGTYDDFSGSRDPGEEHALVTAAREWNEEGLVTETTGLSEEDIRDFIDIEKSNNTQCIIAYSRSEKVKTVVYITDVNRYKNKLLYRFYDARDKATQFHNKEKDRIAVVNLVTLKNAIVKHKDRTKPVKVYVSVLDPITKKFNKELVTLRPFFVSKLRFYFLDKPYTQGMNKKIRFYFADSQITDSQVSVPAKQSWSDWFRSWMSWSN